MYDNQFTPRAQNALRLAQEAAEELGHSYVGSEHLLLGPDAGGGGGPDPGHRGRRGRGA